MGLIAGFRLLRSSLLPNRSQWNYSVELFSAREQSELDRAASVFFKTLSLSHGFALQK